MSYVKKPSVVRIDPTVTHLQPDQFDNDDPIQGYPFGTSAMRVTTAIGFPEISGDVITSRTTDDTGSQIFVGEKAYIRVFEGSMWSSWRELGESGSAEWDDIINKPSQFPPSQHTHVIEDIIGLQAALDNKASAQLVNELQQEVDEHKAESTQNAHLAKNIGIEDAAGNFTATDVERALAELFTSVSDGKTLIAAAITDMGGSASGSDTFQQLANAIRAISTGKPYATGTYQSSTAWNYLTVNNLTFRPRVIIIRSNETGGFAKQFVYSPVPRLDFNNVGLVYSAQTVETGVSWEITDNGFTAAFTSYQQLNTLYTWEAWGY